MYEWLKDMIIGVLANCLVFSIAGLMLYVALQIPNNDIYELSLVQSVGYVRKVTVKNGSLLCSSITQIETNKGTFVSYGLHSFLYGAKVQMHIYKNGKGQIKKYLYINNKKYKVIL